MARELLKDRDVATPVVDIAADIERFATLGVLGTLLADRSTGGNIIWASSVFADKGESYAPADEIYVADVTGANSGIIRARAAKSRDAQVALTRAHAEVFTPVWVVRKMVGWADEAWYASHVEGASRDDGAGGGGGSRAASHDQGGLTWRAYVQSARQMDGLTDCVPDGALGTGADGTTELRLGDPDATPEQMEMSIAQGRGAARIYDWEHARELEFGTLKREVTLMDNERRIAAR